MHVHHILPKHAGGTDEPENLTPPISIALHAEFHKDLWMHYRNKYDYIAWKALSGRISSEEARLLAAKVGQEQSELYKSTRKNGVEYLASGRTLENCSKGGKASSKKLVEWINNNKELHTKNASLCGKSVGKKLCIPHEYDGLVYSSIKELLKVTGMSRCGFYGKLKRGVIRRLEKTKPQVDSEEDLYLL